MQKPQELIRIGEIGNPGIPRRIGQAVADASEDERHHQDRVRRVDGVDDVRGDVETGTQPGDAPLAEMHMDDIV